MLQAKAKVSIDTERMIMRLPRHDDFASWATLRRESREFLEPWEPAWSSEHLQWRSFISRVQWAVTGARKGTAMPLFIFRREDNALLGAITLDNIRRGPAQTGTLGYWIGACYANSGYMSEAVTAVVYHAFERLDLSRVEAACLPENKASRTVLEKTGFKYEGVAQSYLEIGGRWRNHVLYAQLRADRRGRV